MPTAQADILDNIQATVSTTKANATNTLTTVETQLKDTNNKINALSTEIDNLTKAQPINTAKIVEASKNLVNVKADYDDTSVEDKHELLQAQKAYDEALSKSESDAKSLETKTKELDELKASLPNLNSQKSSAETLITDSDTIGGGLAAINGTDAFSAKIINEALKYYGGGIVYTQGGARGSVTWNNDGSKVLGGYLDCSAFVTQVMQRVGVQGVTLGSTETLFGYNGTILREISRSEATTGDIFVVGTPGYSTGNGGHTGIFLDNNVVIHTSQGYWDNGGSGNVYINEYPGNNFGLEPHFYRIVR